jgi:membrane-associated protease RseP (regulator of RpoE activity)
MAADVYSGKGLRTMAGLLEKLERRTEAEEYLRKIDERYDSPGLLVEFLVRHREEPQFQKSLERLVKETFPAGAEPARAGGIRHGRPEGAAVSWVPEEPRPAAPFKVGDIIVGVDSVRVRSLRQMSVQQRLSTADEALILFWRAGATQEAKLPRKAIGDYGFAVDPPRH